MKKNITFKDKIDKGTFTTFEVNLQDIKIDRVRTEIKGLKGPKDQVIILQHGGFYYINKEYLDTKRLNGSFLDIIDAEKYLKKIAKTTIKECDKIIRKCEKILKES